MSEKHSMKVEKIMQATAESMETSSLKVEKLDGHLDRGLYQKYMMQIRHLGRNALDTHQSHGFSARKEDVTDLHHQYLKDSEHGELFVGVKDDVVVAFVALKKNNDGSKKMAVIDQIRYAAGLDRPERIVAGVLTHVKSALESKGVLDAEIISNGEHHKLSKLEGTSWFKKMFDIADSKDEGDSAEAPLDAHV